MMSWFPVSLLLVVSVNGLQASNAFVKTGHVRNVFEWNPKAFQELVNSYVSWGSIPGKELPDCKTFDELFTGNKTWISPFAVPNGLAIFDVAKSCKDLAQNLSWHSGSLTPGNYIYPFYTSSHDVQFAGFVWTAAGGASEFEKFFGLKEYDFSILTVMEPAMGGESIFLAKDSFWPEANGSVPDSVKTLADRYASLMGGDCKKFPDLFGNENRYVRVSGNDNPYEGTTGLTTYCQEVMYAWSKYTYKIDHVSYGVGPPRNETNYVAFTWVRMGVYNGQAKTQQLLTEMGIENEDPIPEIKIGGAFDYFEIDT